MSAPIKNNINKSTKYEADFKPFKIHNYSIITEITEILSLFRSKKYIEFNNQWIKTTKTISNKSIELHLKGINTLGYTCTKWTGCICFDLDCHNVTNEEKKIKKLISLYENIISNFGKPSFVVRTKLTGGLHLYYKLDNKILFKTLELEIKKKLKYNMNNIEILPTPNKPIRFPFNAKNGGHFLDVDSLKPIQFYENPFMRACELIIKSDKKSIFTFTDPTIKAPVNWLTDKKTYKQVKNYSKVVRFDKYLNKIIPELKEGNTNEPIENIAFNGYINGFDTDLVCDHIENALLNNGIPRKKDTVGKRIKQRVESHFKRFNKNKKKYLDNKYLEFKQKTNLVDYTKDEYISNSLKKLGEMHLNKKKGIEKFLSELYIWTLYIRSLSKDDILNINTHYKTFYLQVYKNKNIPLPKNLIKQWNQRYFNIIRMLKDKSIIELRVNAFNPYRAKLNSLEIIGTCNYYRVNL